MNRPQKKKQQKQLDLTKLEHLTDSQAYYYVGFLNGLQNRYMREKSEVEESFSSLRKGYEHPDSKPPHGSVDKMMGMLTGLKTLYADIDALIHTLAAQSLPNGLLGVVEEAKEWQEDMRGDHLMIEGLFLNFSRYRSLLDRDEGDRLEAA